MSSSPAPQRFLRLVHLDRDLVERHGARCMDGSPGGLYYAPASAAANRSRLVVFIEGGGECRTLLSCATWAWRAGSSSDWPLTMRLPHALPKVWPGSPMDPDPQRNPDFHDWAKLSLPYCSGDMHSGTRTERDAKTGWFFAGHSLIVAALAQFTRSWPEPQPTEAPLTDASPLTHAPSPSPSRSPSGPPSPLPSPSPSSSPSPSPSPRPRPPAHPHSRTHPLPHPSPSPWRKVLLTGSSAGGIGALLHADVLAAHWPAASVKASPESGLFYAGVRSLADFRRGAQTPPEHMGLHHMWRPFVPPACAAAWGSVLAPGACTHAHLLLPHVATPLFLRENQFDSAKLANCGLDVHSHMGEAELSYLKEWGGLVRSEMRAVSARPRNGAWSPSCLAHAGNLGFASSPRLALPGWRADDDGQLISLREVFRAWYFETANTSLPRAVVAECGELPCSNASEGQACPRLLARECGPACARARRKRRIRDGKSPDGPGRNVCDFSAAGGGDAGDVLPEATSGRLAHLLKPPRQAGELVAARRGGALQPDPALEPMVDRLV